MAKYCSNCGRELPDEAMYCPDCGKEYIPRTKADFPENNSGMNSSSASDYEFNGPFGPSKKKFEGPFGPHSNRGSDSNNSFNTSHSESNSESNSSSNQSSKNGSFGDRLSDISNRINNMSSVKLCCIVFIVLMIASCITSLATYDDSNNLDTYDSSAFSESANDLNSNDYKFNNGNFVANSSADDGHYNLSIDKNAYISDKGSIQLIDSNHSYNLESDNFNITEYETYYISIDEDNWYIIDVFKCKFDTLSQSQVYATDLSDGDPIIIYGEKGSYYGYGILMPNSSNDSKYKNNDFLESIFHYKKD